MIDGATKTWLELRDGAGSTAYALTDLSTGNDARCAPDLDGLRGLLFAEGRAVERMLRAERGG